MIGRSFVVHINVDDEGIAAEGNDQARSEITGNAGRRLACGVIMSLGDYQAQI